MIDVAEAIDVALTLLRGAFVWALLAGLATSGLVLLCAWAVTSGTRAAWRGVTGAWRRKHGPEVNDCHSDTGKPSERRTAPHATASPSARLIVKEN